jgi:hypothetical protein
LTNNFFYSGWVASRFHTAKTRSGRPKVAAL